jgi:hypothetical protein
MNLDRHLVPKAIAGRVSAIALIVAAAIVAASCRTETSKPAGNTPAAGPGWTSVANFNGDGRAPQDTAPFTVQRGKVRVVYTVQPSDSGPVPFLWQMFRVGTPVGPNESARNSCVSCEGPQTNDLGSVPAAAYYLHVITSRPWKLTVEESR